MVWPLGSPDASLDSLSLTERIQADMTAAAKAQDRQRLAALRLLLDALQKEAKQARGELDEQGEIAVLKRERKRRAEAADAYRKGGRDDAAAAEEAEADLIDEYLPGPDLRRGAAGGWSPTRSPRPARSPRRRWAG